MSNIERCSLMHVLFCLVVSILNQNEGFFNRILQLGSEDA